MINTAIRVLVFTKAPIIGQVKTRFCPPLTHAEAATLSLELCEKTLQNVAAVDGIDPELWVALDPTHEKVTALASQYGVPIYEQIGENLGARMAHAFAARQRPGLVIGSDIPQCNTARLQKAVDILRSGREVIGPTPDGGYYLLGLQKPKPALFENIDWGSTSVLQQTLGIARSTQSPLTMLEPLRDLDTMDDLLHQLDGLPDFKHWGRTS
ncbi:MAG: glycosyltransferase [Proteobacteria bacterium]|jgi:uncharacterized protein|nr:glycosyltransferase [Pseudomonadota bacterium]